MSCNNCNCPECKAERYHRYRYNPYGYPYHYNPRVEEDLGNFRGPTMEKTDEYLGEWEDEYEVTAYNRQNLQLHQQKLNSEVFLLLPLQYHIYP